jgi:glycosyltransferase involved in cell wall biosynthesis
MIKYPKISIITPNYFGAQYLEETIQSVLGQNYPNLEYVIIDGGSTDGSIEIIKKYEHQLKYWISEPDQGMYHAIQKGFERSTGEIMSWINSDDMYHRNSFFTVAEIFGSFREVNWLLGASTAYDTLGRTISCGPSRQFTKYDIYARDFKWIQQESTFWRRSLWEKAGASLNLNLKYAGDFDLWVRFFAHEKLYVTRALIGGFRWRTENQLSLDHMDEYLKEADIILSSRRLTPQERKILRDYKRLLWLVRVIQKLKIFRTDWMISYFRNKYFDEPKNLFFDRHRKKFIISK